MSQTPVIRVIGKTFGMMTPVTQVLNLSPLKELAAIILSVPHCQSFPNPGVFAGSAFTYCPLTSDYGAFRLFLNDIHTNIIPLGGTALAEAIQKGISTFETNTKNHKAIILISDGENHEDDPLKAAVDVKGLGIVIYTVGVGKKDGSYIKIKEESGQDKFLKDRQGQVIKSRLDEITLNKIALETGGLYTPGYGTKWGVEKIYKDSIAKIEGSAYATQRVKRYVNRYQIPLFIAIVLTRIPTSLPWVVIGYRSPYPTVVMVT